MEEGIRFDGTLALALNTSDRARAAEWYRERLGFDVIYDSPEMAFCEMSTPVAGVTIVLAEVQEVPVAGGAVPTFGVEDVDSARATLEAHGVRFDGEAEEIPDVVKLATLYDLDGNALMLSQDLQQKH